MNEQNTLYLNYLRRGKKDIVAIKGMKKYKASEFQNKIESFYTSLLEKEQIATQRIMLLFDGSINAYAMIFVFSKLGKELVLVSKDTPVKILESIVISYKIGYIILPDTCFEKDKNLLSKTSVPFSLYTKYYDSGFIEKKNLKKKLPDEVYSFYLKQIIHKKDLSNKVADNRGSMPFLFVQSASMTDRLICFSQEEILSFVETEEQGKTFLSLYPYSFIQSLSFTLYALLHGTLLLESDRISLRRADYILSDIDSKTLYTLNGSKHNQTILLTGEKIKDKELLKTIQKGRKIYDLYSVSEEGNFFLYRDINEKNYHIIPNKDVEIRKESNINKKCDINEEGILIVSSDSMMLGYLKLRRDAQPFHVGKDNTYLVLEERAKLNKDGTISVVKYDERTIKRNGYNLDFFSMEALSRTLDDIQDSHIIYIESKDRLTLYIQSHSKDDFTLSENLKNLLREYYVDELQPDLINFLPIFPRDIKGNINVDVLKKF